MKPRIICTVTNDLTYDQRMNRICSSLADAGYLVTLVGRKRRSSVPLVTQPYLQKRLNCWFDSGKLFYLEYNLRLLIWLIFKKCEVIHIVDLDTMIPGIIAGQLKGWKKVYDAHEYFTEMEEVVKRKAVQRIWKKIERWGIPKVDGAITVSNGYAKLFSKEYPMSFSIVRNVTVKTESVEPPAGSYILYQGAVNHGRGLENVVRAMQKVDFPLIICGGGDVFDHLKILVNQLNLAHKITLTGYLPPKELRAYTTNAKIGLTLFENQGLSNQFSLANRFFDYFHAGIPQLAMKYPDYIEFTKEHPVALLIESTSVEHITLGINRLLSDTGLYQSYCQATSVARNQVNWQNESQILLELYSRI